MISVFMYFRFKCTANDLDENRNQKRHMRVPDATHYSTKSTFITHRGNNQI